MRQIKSCGVLVFRSHPVESFLLMQHADRLDLPKGHVDPGETDVQCALRELQEETGIAADDIELDPAFRFTTNYLVRPKRFGGEEMEKKLVIFLGRLQRDVNVQLTEHQSFVWVPWNPPHRIQQQTIDPLLEKVAELLG